MLTVFIDFNSPASYLAFEPTVQLAERFQIEVRWRPFRTVLQPIPLKVPNETPGQSHRRVRAIARQQTHIHYAKLKGIDLSFPDSPGKTDLALGVLAQFSTNPETFIRLAFQAYWQDKEHLNDVDTVDRIIKRSENEELVHTSQAQSSLDEALKVAEERGVIDAPTYIIQNNVFVGREHLPWIEDILTASARERQLDSRE